MARTVSKSTDVSGESVAVPVTDLGGHFEDHKPDPTDLSAARVPTSVPNFKGMKDIQTADWIENLMTGSTVFTSDKGAFKLSGAGFHGSVQPIAEEIRRDPYLLRAVQRGRIAFLTEDEAMEKIAKLVDESEGNESHIDRLRESFSASENSSMHKPGVPDEGEPNGPSQTWEQIWSNSTSNPKAKPSK